jgi:hypothetical protein
MVAAMLPSKRGERVWDGFERKRSGEGKECPKSCALALDFELWMQWVSLKPSYVLKKEPKMFPFFFCKFNNFELYIKISTYHL